MIEEFRQQAVDRAIFALITKGEEVKMEKGFLKEETRKKVAEKVLERIHTVEVFRGEEMRLSQIMKEQGHLSYQFFINEESGEKIYKLVIVKLTQQEMMKIISKESKGGGIHFIIRLSKLDPGTGEVISEETRYKSTEQGVTKEQFKDIVDAIISKLPENAEVKIHDMSHYSSLKDQFSTGVMDGFFNISTNKSNEWH